MTHLVFSDPDNESDSDTKQRISEGPSSEEADSSSDDDVPLAELQNKDNAADDSGNQRSVPKASHTFRWRKISALKPSDILWTGPFSNPPDDKEPAGYFHRFFPNSLIHVIVEQTLSLIHISEPTRPY